MASESHSAQQAPPGGTSVNAETQNLGRRALTIGLRIRAQHIVPGFSLTRNQETAGILPPVAGNVTLNGQPLSQIDEGELRSKVSFFAEDAHIFATTLRENIRVVDPALTDDHILKVLSEAGLDEWVRGLEEGLDTQLGSFGEDISGGERRRLLLARAIAKSAPITILDEPTEHLDPARADSLMRKILTPGELFPSTHPVIVITHDARFRESGARVIDLSPTGAIH